MTIDRTHRLRGAHRADMLYSQYLLPVAAGSVNQGLEDLTMSKFDRYLRVVIWAQRRYIKDGYLITHVGLNPSVYTRIEYAATRKYLGFEP